MVGLVADSRQMIQLSAEKHQAIKFAICKFIPFLGKIASCPLSVDQDLIATSKAAHAPALAAVLRLFRPWPI